MEHISTLVPQQVYNCTLSNTLPALLLYVGWPGADFIMDGGKWQNI